MITSGFRRGRLLAFGLIVALTAGAAAAPQTSAFAASSGEIRLAGGATAVPDSYIVVLKDDATRPANAATVTTAADRLKGEYGGDVARVYGAALNGFEMRISQQSARRLAADPAVAYVEQNHTVSVAASGVQLNPPSWGLDRIDQRYLPLNQRYAYPNTAPNVHAYLLDTGIRRTHVDLGGRVLPGYDNIDGLPADDCNGHGTFMSGVVGGKLHGVAKEVRLVPVRVLNCSGSGTYAGVIDGVNWVTANAVRPAVALMTLGGAANTSIDTAVTNSINSGITYVVVSGSSNSNACNYSPARVPAAITVAGTTSTDARMTSGNYGSCLDIYAPGQSITSIWNTSDTAVVTISGGSAAASHVAGCAALILSANPTWTPAQVANRIYSTATVGVVTGVPAGTVNRLLYCIG